MSDDKKMREHKGYNCHIHTGHRCFHRDCAPDHRIQFDVLIEQKVALAEQVKELEKGRETLKKIIRKRREELVLACRRIETAERQLAGAREALKAIQNWCDGQNPAGECLANIEQLAEAALRRDEEKT